MWRFKILILIGILVSGCTSNPATTNSNFIQKGWQWLYDEKEVYKIGVPPNFEIGKHAIQGVIQGPGFFSDDIDVQIYPSPTSCAPEILGYPEIMSESSKGDEKTIWGKVYDDRGMGNTPSRDALCGYPQASRECQSIGEGCDDGVGAYAFCSEKENFLGIGEPKRVVICISQQTDDPKMAEEIFKTFKWID